MLNIERLNLELNDKDYFGNAQQDLFENILTDNNLDPLDEYVKDNDRVNMLESVYDVLNMLSNDIDKFRRVETEFVTTSAAYQYLQKRLRDLRAEIDRVKLETAYTDEQGNTSSIIGHLYFNSATKE
ncbi:MAG: hypothetical protein MR885_04890 [Ruminococcus bromii]|nr:hypothetical protein [Ruminococcus bromii]